jgi:hypothetical protein|tara:strand:- start:203 stop:1396 length:1194 start_codon:yes stop_codon:yes gene_type:complete
MGVIGRILGNLKSRGGSFTDRMSARAFDMDNRFRNSNDMRERMPLPNMPIIDEGIISSPVRGGLPPRGRFLPPRRRPMPILQEPINPIRGGNDFLPRPPIEPIMRPMPMPITQPIPPSKGINLKELKGLGQMTGDEAIGRKVPKMPDISLLRPEDRRRFLQNRPIARPEMPVMMLPDIEVGQQLPPPMPSVDMQMDELEPIESFAKGGVVEDQMPEIPDEDLPQMAEGGFLGVGGAKSAQEAAKHLANIGFDNEEIARRLIKDVPKDLFGEGVSEMDRQQLIKLRNYLDIMKQKRMPPSLLQKGLGALRSVGRGLMMNPFKVSPQGLAGAGLGAAGVALIDQFMDDDLSENEMEQLKLLIDEQLNKKEGEVEPTEEGGVKISEQSIEFRPASSLEMM